MGNILETVRRGLWAVWIVCGSPSGRIPLFEGYTVISLRESLSFKGGSIGKNIPSRHGITEPMCMSEAISNTVERMFNPAADKNCHAMLTAANNPSNHCGLTACGLPLLKPTAPSGEQDDGAGPARSRISGDGQNQASDLDSGDRALLPEEAPSIDSFKSPKRSKNSGVSFSGGWPRATQGLAPADSRKKCDSPRVIPPGMNAGWSSHRICNSNIALETLPRRRCVRGKSPGRAQGPKTVRDPSAQPQRQHP
ncbi:hypothetical protein QBC47DRAFT_357066 [Echria macrotheca]|uniref:Uncharacterized protein n=1 Tax=Echria macrotheca TaxID=438768 RepID=A0AAJ0FDB3_9PEZI|nr:hypothetical protein QBC47DRAFT_357066 [Echria macrotheca]